MGEVYRAHDAVLERRVAIKVLHRSLSGDAAFVERFRREARAAANLNHPNIVAVHDWGAADGIYYMVMEHVAGQSVRELLNAEGLLAPAQATDVLAQALSALEHAHRQGIVHRDVKPENLMVTRDGVVKVADFGLARAYADAQITEAGTVTGTVQYLAPEQLVGEPADPRTDLYALGIVAFELLTGRLPFSGETSMAIAYKHIHERVPAPSSRNPAVPASLDGWVASVTEKQRELRPESAAEARRDLEADSRALPPAPPVASLVSDLAVIADPMAEVPPDTAAASGPTTVTIPRQQVRHRRRKGLVIVGILLALVAMVAAAWGTWTYLIPHRVEVPSVVGMPVEDARQLLEDEGLVPRMADGRHSRQVDVDVVLAVQPSEGTTLEQGDRVTIVPSLGPSPVQVPALIGVPLSEAKERLRQADLKVGDVTRAYSDSLGIDQVIRQSVQGGAEAPFGSEIDLVISRGPSPVAVPRVVGATEEDATSELQSLGFLVTVDEEFSEDVARGRVISQDPGKGSQLQPGNAVTIVVSLGPPEFPMPNVVGMSRDAAIARLTDLGLRVDVAIVPGYGGAQVVFQEPATGTIVHAGDLVKIFVA